MHPIAETFITLFREVRGRTLGILGKAEADWLLWTPPPPGGTANHMAWHAGHVLWVQELLCVEPLTGRVELPGPDGTKVEGSDWERRFGMESKPALDRGPWPAREELREMLARQQQRVEAILVAADPAKLSDMTPRSAGESGIGWGIVHGFHDEAIHQGEMFLLLKLCRARQGKVA